MPGTAKVGALVILFLALLAGGYTLLGRFLPWSKTKTLYARFDDATGVALGTKVLMAGVPVGSVTETRLQPDGRSALLTLRLDEGARVPRGTRATIPASFIGFGDVAIHLLPPAETTALEESPGATLVGFRPGTLDSMLPSDNPTVRELTATMRATRELLGDQGLRTDLRKLLQSTNDTLVRFGGLATETQSLLARNRGQLDLALRNTARAMEDVEQSASMVAKLMKEGKLQAKSLALLDQLGATAGKAQTLVGDLDRFVTDPKLREPLAQTMGHVAQITDTGTKIATNT
ncbi:MAG: MCE family protein, partial [Fimbriimonas ginsengisoli]|nr:MCE family protein [Fimbriimonas ginsengisoli]